MKYKRILKRVFSKDTYKIGANSKNIAVGGSILSIIIFVAIQLITNAILTPLGHELQSLNQEKAALIEENRILEQQIAKADSIIVIDIYSKEKLELQGQSDQEVYFVTDNSIQAITLR